jgi:hypothetical protein
MAERILKTFRTAVWVSLFASLAAANTANSAGAKAGASATIIAAANVSVSAAAYTQVLFSSSTGTLSIRIPVSSAASGLIQSPCGGGLGNYHCNAPMRLQVVKDGTLTGQQGVSLSVTREIDSSGVLTALLAYK